MAHNLFGNRFVSNRVPAWHNLGYVTEEPITAVAAFQKFGPYQVRMEDVTAGGVPIPYKAIMRSPTPDDQAERCFGVVSPQYTLITPLEMCEIWDEVVNKPIETLGALYKGETMFVTTKLPSYDVKGDEIEDYLLVKSPMNGWGAIEVMDTPIRTVCHNTLILARSMATEVLKIVHDATARQRAEMWLKELYARAEQRSVVVKEAFEVLAAARLTDAQAADVFKAAYSDPKVPVRNVPDDVFARRQSEFDIHLRRAGERRAAALELFQGKGRGMDTPAAAGTAWGAYNAVVELEDFRPAKTDATGSIEALFGSRAEAKERAFSAALAISRN